MYKTFALVAMIGTKLLFADAAPPIDNSLKTEAKKPSTTSNNFTGKIVGDNVRMRVAPDLDGHIVSELNKDDYIVVTGEQNDFYAVEPPSDLQENIWCIL